MSKIREYLTTILSARYGRDVRQSIHDAIDEINGVASTAQGSAAANAASAANSASAAKVSETAAKASEEAAGQHETNAKTYADNAQAIAGAGIATQDTAGFMKGGDNYVDEGGTLMLTKTTTDSTLLHSHAGGLEIKSVEGMSVQGSTTGAQLLDYDIWKTVSIKNGTAVFENNGITITATANDAFTYYGVQDGSYPFPEDAHISVSEGETITLSWDESTNSFGNVYIFGNGSPDNKASTSNAVAKSLQYTVPAGVEFVTFRFGVATEGTTISYRNIMINKGADIIPWELYTGGAPSPSPSYQQEIKSTVVSEIKAQGAQLFNKNTVKTGYYNKSGTKVENTYWSNAIIPCKIGTYYTLSGSMTSNADVNTVALDSDGELISVLHPLNTEFTVQAPEGASFIAFSVKTSEVDAIMINEGSAALPWRAYEETTITLSEPITLNGAGTAKDRIVKQDGVWGVEWNIKKVVFDGSNDEAWSYNGYHEATGKVRYCITLSSVVSVADTDNVVRAIADKLRGGTRALLDENGVNSVFVGDSRRIFLVLSINDVGTQNVTSLKTWLSNNPITVYYQTEAAFEELPEADQIALHSLPTYDGVTYVATDSEVEAVIEKVYGTSKVGAAMLLNKHNNVLQDIELEQHKKTLSLHTTRISQINSNFTALSKRVSKLEWIKSNMNCTGKMFATVPADVAEIRLVADLGGRGIHHEIPILEIDITDEMKYYRDGYVINIDHTTFQVNGGVVEFGIYTNGATLNLAYLNGEDVTDSTTWTFYYRKNS